MGFLNLGYRWCFLRLGLLGFLLEIRFGGIVKSTERRRVNVTSGFGNSLQLWDLMTNYGAGLVSQLRLAFFYFFIFFL